MTEFTINSNELKDILKKALIELFQENRSEFSELISEIIEDIAMEKAIQEGEYTETVSKNAIFKLQER